MMERVEGSSEVEQKDVDDVFENVLYPRGNWSKLIEEARIGRENVGNVHAMKIREEIYRESERAKKSSK